MKYEAVVIGASSGGMSALKLLFGALPARFRLPLIIVQHVGPRSDSQWIALLNSQFAITIKEADEKERALPGHVYIAPPNYHLLIERDKTFSLAASERVSYARPSIDVLFESAAEAYLEKLVGVVLTGANADGTTGMVKIKRYGGLTLVQDPATAESPFMPASVLQAMRPDHVLSIEKLIDKLLRLGTGRT